MICLGETMAEIYQNPLCGVGLTDDLNGKYPQTSINAEAPIALLKHCPQHEPTPLLDMTELAAKLGVQSISLKDERQRMGLGSFKALGAAYVIASHAMQSGNDLASSPLEGKTYVTASAGNHGLSVAAGARIFGANAIIYLSKTVPEEFSQLLERQNATAVRRGDDYEQSMQAALEDTKNNSDLILLSDSSWPGYEDLPYLLMEGYLVLAAEMQEQIANPPTHLFLQAGVGGLASAIAGYARHVFGDALQIIVVEPDFAPALIEAIKAKKLVDTSGPVSEMGRLDCKTASLIAFKSLAKSANTFITITESDGDNCVFKLAEIGISTTASGGAGFAPMFMGEEFKHALGIDSNSRIAAIISEELSV
jgi:diaminopropionate ammonia-lyase